MSATSQEQEVELSKVQFPVAIYICILCELQLHVQDELLATTASLLATRTTSVCAGCPNSL